MGAAGGMVVVMVVFARAGRFAGMVAASAIFRRMVVVFAGTIRRVGMVVAMVVVMVLRRRNIAATGVVVAMFCAAFGDFFVISHCGARSPS